jgi:hypothetical protein
MIVQCEPWFPTSLARIDLYIVDSRNKSPSCAPATSRRLVGCERPRSNTWPVNIGGCNYRDSPKNRSKNRVIDKRFCRPPFEDPVSQTHSSTSFHYGYCLHRRGSLVLRLHQTICFCHPSTRNHDFDPWYGQLCPKYCNGDDTANKRLCYPASKNGDSTGRRRKLLRIPPHHAYSVHCTCCKWRPTGRAATAVVRHRRQKAIWKGAE